MSGKNINDETDYHAVAAETRPVPITADGLSAGETVSEINMADVKPIDPSDQSHPTADDAALPGSVAPILARPDRSKLDDPTGFSVTISKKNYSKKAIFYLAAAVMLLLAVGSYVWSQRSNTKDSQSGELGAYAAVSGEARAFETNKDYDSAIKKWESYLEQPASTERTYEAHLQIATLKQRNGDIDGALASYLAADKIDPSRATHFEALAKIYEVKKNTGKALEYYKKARDTFPQDHPFRDAEVRWLDKKIKSLE